MLQVGKLCGTYLHYLEDISKYPEIVSELLNKYDEQPKILKK